jgi:hypothetical protein
MGLAALSETIDDLFHDGAASVADPESIVELLRQRARLDAFVASAVAAFDKGEVWADDGATNPAIWLAVRTRMPKAATKRMVKLGRSLAELPLCAQAWAAGEICDAHVAAVTRVRNERTEKALERDEPLLVEQASTLRFDGFERALKYWEQLNDPDGVEVDAAARRARREAYLVSSFNGTWFGKLTLDEISGAIVANELERIGDELFETDWAAAKERLGRDPLATELGRTAVQRRADAFVEMAARSSLVDGSVRRARPLFTVLIDFDTAMGRLCEIAQGTIVTPGSLVPYLVEAEVERAVMTPENRVEVSEKARFFTGATRRAIMLRDRECSHPYCDIPAERCEGDHKIPFSEGGPTTQENGRALCPFHNRLRNREQRPPPPQEE